MVKEKKIDMAKVQDIQDPKIIVTCVRLDKLSDKQSVACASINLKRPVGITGMEWSKI